MTVARSILLLDLGGVLADLGDPVQAMGLPLSTDKFWAFWLSSPQVHAFEKGMLNTSEFCSQLAFELGIDEGDFEHHFRSWRLRLFSGAEELIRSVASRYTLALLSNTNEVHWEQVETSTDLFSSFDKTFLSFETGNYKPTPESYQQVTTFYGCDPSEILFLDDSPKNVSAAREMGIDAREVRGIAGVAKILDSF